MDSNWVKIYGSSQAYLVEIAKGVLKENGIEGVILNKKDSAYSMIGEVELYISKTQYLEALSILKSHDL